MFARIKAAVARGEVERKGARQSRAQQQRGERGQTPSSPATAQRRRCQARCSRSRPSSVPDPRAGAALAGANAAVVGILGAALYTPVFTAGVSGVITLSITVVCYAAPTSWKVPPWAVVIGAALVGWIVL